MSCALIAPRSVAGWYAALGGDSDSVLVLGEQEPVEFDAVLAHVERSGGPVVRIHSGHDSFRRDRTLADRLEKHAFDARAQSGLAVDAGLDKVVARSAMQAAGILLTDWGVEGITPPIGALVKSRDSTQSRAIGWLTPSTPIGPDTYWERWTEGDEYSVVGYRELGATTLLPIVGKGPSRRDLLPPWRRLRTVERSDPPFASSMLDTAHRIAELFDVWGFFEVEFVVADDVRVIELNPRISGTLRLAAMAGEQKIFSTDWPDPAATVVRPSLVGIEVPYQGAALVEDGLIATSRLTCVGPSMDEVRSRLKQRMPTLSETVDR